MKEKAKAFEGAVCRLNVVLFAMVANIGNSWNIWGCFLFAHIHASF